MLNTLTYNAIRPMALFVAGSDFFALVNSTDR
jgi:hypothetical protein